MEPDSLSFFLLPQLENFILNPHGPGSAAGTDALRQKGCKAVLLCFSRASWDLQGQRHSADKGPNTIAKGKEDHNA